MADDVTNANSPPVEQGSMTSTAEGATTQVAQAEVKTFTQAQVDEIIKARLAEQSRKLATKFEADTAAKIQSALAEREQTLEQQIEERVTARLNEKALADTRASIQAEYGLTDAQTARLTGATPDELKADAEALFGALKQAKPPVVRRGEAGGDAQVDISKMTPAEIREKARELYAQMFR